MSEGVGFKTSAFIKNRSLSSVILPLNIYYIIGKYQVEILKGEVARGSGCVVISYSDDKDGSAKVILHWKDYPYQHIYGGEEIVR